MKGRHHPGDPLLFSHLPQLSNSFGEQLLAHCRKGLGLSTLPVSQRVNSGGGGQGAHLKDVHTLHHHGHLEAQASGQGLEGDRGHTASLATLTCGPSTPLSSTSAHLHLGGVCYTLEDRVMGVQSCGTKVG